MYVQRTFIEDRTTLTPNKETSQLANTSVVIITIFSFPHFFHLGPALPARMLDPVPAEEFPVISHPPNPPKSSICGLCFHAPLAG